jgi:hypothetical protein
MRLPVQPLVHRSTPAACTVEAVWRRPVLAPLSAQPMGGANRGDIWRPGSPAGIADRHTIPAKYTARRWHETIDPHPRRDTIFTEQYVIPVFQRNYRWQLPKWRKFWESLVERRQARTRSAIWGNGHVACRHGSKHSCSQKHTMTKPLHPTDQRNGRPPL